MIFGATGVNYRHVNGVYLYKGMKNEKPFYKNLANQSFLFFASDGKWYVSNKEDFDASKAFGWCRSVESGLGHPSLAHLWKMQVGRLASSDQWEEQPSVKVATMVPSHV